MWASIPPNLRRYLWIEGRSSRREWWQVEILAIASYWFVGSGATMVAVLHGQPPLLPMPVRLALAALMFWINVASTVRRLHDRNKSGWWALLYLFPVFGIIWHFIECGLLPPRNHGNRYGPAPMSPSLSDQFAALTRMPLIPEAPRPAKQQPTPTGPVPAAPAHRAGTRAARPARTIGRPTVSAVTRTRSPNKLMFVVAAAAVAIAVLASSVVSLRATETGVPKDLPVFAR